MALFPDVQVGNKSQSPLCDIQLQYFREPSIKQRILDTYFEINSMPKNSIIRQRKLICFFFQKVLNLMASAGNFLHKLKFFK